jgi:hypothetical protein
MRSEAFQVAGAIDIQKSGRIVKSNSTLAGLSYATLMAFRLRRWRISTLSLQDAE